MFLFWVSVFVFANAFGSISSWLLSFCLCDIHFLYIGVSFYILHFPSPYSLPLLLDYISNLYFYLSISIVENQNQNQNQNQYQIYLYLYERYLCVSLYTRPHLGKVYSRSESLSVVEREEKSRLACAWAF